MGYYGDYAIPDLQVTVREETPYGWLTNNQRTNLMRLAIYLDTLPRDYREFDMESFFETKEGDETRKLERKYARKNGGVRKCGTSACAVGHGPSAGILVPDEYIEKGDDEWEIDWHQYANDFFVGDDDGGSTRLFNWLFGGEWDRVDNHHYGAAARIKFVLMGERIPEIFHARSPKRKHLKLYEKYRKRKQKNDDLNVKDAI